MSDSIAAYLQTLPLAYYHCTFFFPLIPALNKKLPPEPEQGYEWVLNEATVSPEERAAFHYFTPILRNVIFNQGIDPEQQMLQPLREWRLPTAMFEDWSLTLEALPPDPKKYVVPDKVVRFRSVRLYQYFNGLQLLAFTVQPQENESMMMEDWLHFTRLARQLYPTFVEQELERKIAPLKLRQGTVETAALNEQALTIPAPSQSSEHLSPIIIKLLEAFFPNQTASIKTWLKESAALYDDRMFISVAYGLPEDSVNCQQEDSMCQERLKQIKALVAFTDRGADAWVKGYPYDRNYIEDYLKDKKLTLWEGAGTSYFYTDKVNAALGGGDFFNNIIAPKHIPYLYDRMLVQALFYQASLKYYDQVITSSTAQLLAPPVNASDRASASASAQDQDASAIQKQYAEFIKFTNQYWFADLTEQMQGKAIGRLQQQGLELKAQYDRILDEINRTSDFLQAKKNLELAQQSLETAKSSEILANASKNLTVYGALFAFLALYYAVIALLKDWPGAVGIKNNDSSWWSWSYWQQWIEVNFASVSDWLLAVVVLGIIPLAFTSLIYWYMKKKFR